MPIELGSASQTKAKVDSELWNQALSLDAPIYESPLRSFPQRKPCSFDLIEHSLIPPKPKIEPLKLLLPALTHDRRNRTAFIPLPDGSSKTFAVLQDLANQPELPFDRALDYLHALGTEDHLGEMIAPISVFRLIQNGVSTSSIPGNHRKLSSGFEYGVFNSSHPNLIGIEMTHLGKRVDLIAQQLKESNGNITGVHIDDLREKLAQTRFVIPEQVENFTDKELLAILGASETQRIIAYIHPWYERVGRTTEEGRGLFALRTGTRPLFLSTPDNRSTLEGYERGIVLGITAVGLLREVGRRFGLDEEQISGIYKTHDLYDPLPLPNVKRAIYNSPLRYALGRNIFPDADVMKKYYQETHNIILGLIDTFDLSLLAQDPYSIYLTGQLIGRGK